VAAQYSKYVKWLQQFDQSCHRRFPGKGLVHVRTGAHRTLYEVDATLSHGCTDGARAAFREASKPSISAWWSFYRIHFAAQILLSSIWWRFCLVGFGWLLLGYF
jgi:hypothetical protein